MGGEKLGLTTGVISYLLWGLLPLYWKQLADVDSMEVLCHRCLWSLVIMIGLLSLGKNKKGEVNIFSIKKKYWIAILAGTACIGLNWFINVKAVNEGQIVACSLGYYINPIFTVFLGTFIFKEKLNYYQWLAVSIACLGLGFLIYFQGQIPWISLSITFTFGCYGMFKKFSPLSTTLRMFIEILLLSFFLIPVLFYYEGTNQFSFSSYPISIKLFLAGAGLATTLPLLCFGHSVIKLNLTTLGFLQYIAPTLQFLMGIFIFDEDLDIGFLVAFGFIWLAILIYTIDRLRDVMKGAVNPDFMISARS